MDAKKQTSSDVVQVSKEPVWRTLEDTGVNKLQNYSDIERRDVHKMFSHQPKIVLDIGCSRGAVGRAIKDVYGTDTYVWGIELNRDAATIAEQRLDKVSTQPIEQLTDTDLDLLTKVDTVLLLDVLEHMYNPWGALKFLSKYLTPKAQVIVSLPNVMNVGILRDLLKGYWRYSEAGLLDVTHIRFFTPYEMNKMFYETGFRVDERQFVILDELAKTPQSKLRLGSAVLDIESREQWDSLNAVQIYSRLYLAEDSVLTAIEQQLRYGERAESSVYNGYETVIDDTLYLRQITRNEKELERSVREIEKLSQELEHTLEELKSSRQELKNKVQELEKKNIEIHTQKIRHDKYKKLWTTRLIKPLIKTEQAISSLNVYRKGFRNLVRDRGSVGKAYQHLRRMRKDSSLKEVKHFLRYGIGYRPQAKVFKATDNKITILVTPHTQFVAHLLENVLHQLGFEVQVTVGEGQHYSDDMYIVICPQMYPSLPNNYIAFQMEQSVSWFTAEYINVLQNSYAILDYSLQNIEFLQGEGVSYKQLFWMPIGFYPNYRQYLLSSNLWDGTTSDQVDIVFYGDPNNERRKKYLNALQAKFNSRVKIVTEKFGNDLYRELLSAKIVVNIHYYENALLETTRIYECLSLGLKVVSEESSDMAQHEALHKHVAFVKMGDVEQMLQTVAKQLDAHQSIDQTNELNHHEVKFYFSRMLLSLNLIKFEQLSAVCGYDSISPNPMSMYCLGLPENIERRASFVKDNVYQITIFDGLRHSIGWVGCGLSYKYLMMYAQQNNLDYLIVCEDDVEFPKDFTEKLNQILDYLTQTTHHWDVFSGLIADLHPDAQIIGIDTYENNEYIYIDKMTSMVFNIYNKSFFEKISCWDNLDTDVETNTIDRYIEMHGGLRVVTTSPFLVGHKEDQTSSLWGFNNSNYSDMFSKTQSLFGAKIDQYKRSHFETNV